MQPTDHRRTGAGRGRIVTTIVTVRPGVQFTPPAAAAFRRSEAQVQKEFDRQIDVNSTYRSRAQQLAMYEAWQRYLRGGPWPGHSKALHPDDPLAFHVTGEALDSDDWTNKRIVQILGENGFIRNRLYVPNEQHHFEYVESLDQNKNKPSGSGNTVGSEEDDMGVYVSPDKNKTVYWWSTTRQRLTKLSAAERDVVVGGKSLPELTIRAVGAGWLGQAQRLG